MRIAEPGGITLMHIRIVPNAKARQDWENAIEQSEVEKGRVLGDPRYGVGNTIGKRVNEFSKYNNIGFLPGACPLEQSTQETACLSSQRNFET